MILLKASKVIYNLLHARFENDNFLKSKNTEEYEKLMKKINVFNFSLPNEKDGLAAKVKFFGRITACRKNYEEIREKILSTEFMSLSSSSAEETDDLDRLLEENYLIFKLNEPRAEYFITKKDKAEIKKKFAAFVDMCVKSDATELLREFAEFNKGEIEAAQMEIISKKAAATTILMNDMRMEPKTYKSTPKKYTETPALFNNRYILSRKFLLDSGINGKTGINEKYIKYTNTVAVNPVYKNEKQSSVEPVIKFGDAYFAMISESGAPCIPEGVAEGYNFYFNEELAKHVSTPLIEMHSNLEKVNIKGKTDDLVDILSAHFGKKDFEKIYIKHIIGRFENIKDPELISEINASMLYDFREFIRKSIGVKDIRAHMKLYFSDDNILSLLYDKIKIINRAR